MELPRVAVRAWGPEGPSAERWNPGTAGSDPTDVRYEKWDADPPSSLHRRPLPPSSRL